MATSIVEIANRALQLLGAEPIGAMTENNKTARVVSLAYDVCRKAELRAHPWNFAIKRAQLAADAVPPLWGKANSFPLPADFLRLIAADPKANFNDIDYQIEGKSIFSDFPAPLQIRYISDVVDPTVFDPLFSEAVSAKIAYEICDQITQSNTDRAAVKDHYKDVVGEARRINAFENIAAQPPEDTWLTARM